MLDTPGISDSDAFGYLLFSDINATITQVDTGLGPDLDISKLKDSLGRASLNGVSANPRKISLTIDVDDLGDRVAAVKRLCVFLMATDYSGPAPLVLERKPGLYIDAMVTGPVSVSDGPGLSVNVDFIAPSPFFKSQQGFYYESPTEITLDGNAPCYPIITLVGPIDHPLITVSNSSGTYTLDLGNLVIASGSNVTIDPGYGEIEPYGYMMQIKGSFPVFMPGLNTISVNGSFNIRGNASWR